MFYISDNILYNLFINLRKEKKVTTTFHSSENMESPNDLINIVHTAYIGNCKISFSKTLTHNQGEDWIRSPHYHGTFEIHYANGQDLSYYIGNNRFLLKADEVCFIPPHIEHFFESDDPHYTKCSFRFSLEKMYSDDEDAYSFLSNILFHFKSTITLTETNVNELFSRLAKTDYMHSFLDKYKFNGYLSLIILNLCEELEKIVNDTNANRDGYASQSIDESFLSYQIELMISQKYNTNLTITDVAEALCVSTKKIERLCQKIFNTNFKKMLQKQRMIIAKALISEGNLSLTEIAYRCGFNSYVGFYKSFKDYYDVIPKRSKETSHPPIQGNRNQ